MEPTTSPQDCRRFDGAESIWFYTNPARIPGHSVMSPTYDWGVLSGAGTGGGLEPMAEVASRLDYPESRLRGGRPELAGIPNIMLEFAYAGLSAIPLFESCIRFDKVSRELPVHLWRFRVADVGGETVEICFRAIVNLLTASHGADLPGVPYGAFRVLDAQPYISGV